MDDLIAQYNELSKEEKNALLIYKSRLGLLINDLDNNPDFNYYYDRYKHIFSNFANSFIKMSVFYSIDFTSIDTFKKSIYQIKDILDIATSKIETDESLTLYRTISSNDEINGLSKGNIISTSLSFADSKKYSVGGSNINIIEINIPPHSKVAVVPYSIKYDENKNLLTLSNDYDDEIILNSNNYQFEETNKEILDDNITLITYDALLLEKKKT